MNHSLPKTYFVHLILLVMGLLSTVGNAQESPPLETVNDTLITDDLGEVTDQFQELFFKALAQSGIENYERAIDYLKKSLSLAPDPSVIHFQLAKNYEKLEDTKNAIRNYQEALEGRPHEDAILTKLCSLYQIQGDVDKAIEIAKKLAPDHPDYYFDLAQLEAHKGHDIIALKHLHTLEKQQGETAEITGLRQRIYRETKDYKTLTTYFQKQIKEYPTELHNFKALIQLYYLHKNFPEAYEAALQLQELAPQETEVDLGLYLHYKDTGKKELALEAMTHLIRDDRLNKNIKMRVIKDFTHFVKDHPEYENNLIAVLGEALNEGQQSDKEMANYYKTRDKKKALLYFEKAIRENPKDYSLIKEALQLQWEQKQYEKICSLSNEALQYFPTQAYLYLSMGKAKNKLKQYEKAEESLLDGVDFVIENKDLLKQFYKALIVTYTHLKQNDQLQYYTDQLGSLKI